MATLVCFHAHPDDECIGTGGIIARASAEGHRVVLVVATNGDHGEFTEGVTTVEDLVVRRREETMASAFIQSLQEKTAEAFYRDDVKSMYDCRHTSSQQAGSEQLVQARAHRPCPLP